MKMSLRHDPREKDRPAIRAILESTDFFSDEEVSVALELLDENLSRGSASGYEFVFVDEGVSPVAYACWGPIACTHSSYDLYWVATRRDRQGMGYGKLLVESVERAVRERGGRRVYIETSGREQYEPTRAFYRSAGYTQEAVLEDFYADGDSKVIFCKVL